MSAGENMETCGGRRRSNTGEPLRDLLADDPEVMAHLSAADLDAAFDLEKALEGVETAFARALEREGTLQS